MTKSESIMPMKSLKAENKVLKTFLHNVYDILYFDGNRKPKPAFNPSKEWDSASDIVEKINEHLLRVMPSPRAGATSYPEIKLT